MSESIILTDVDGVLLNWDFAFKIWMEEKGYKWYYSERKAGCASGYFKIEDQEVNDLIKIFNESAAMGFLPPLRDAIYYVKKLHEEHGYVFHAISSMSDNLNSGKLREMNLKKLFGETVFAKFDFLPTMADKYESLLPYKNTGYFWIEDSIFNADTGEKLGLNPIVMEHAYNMDNKSFTLVKNWKEIYEMLT